MRLKDLISALLAFGVPTSISLMSILVFTRYLPLESYGKLSLAWVTIEFTCGILFGWCKMGMMRFYNQDQQSILISIQLCLIITMILLGCLITLNISNNFVEISNIRIISVIIIGIIAKGLSYFIQDIQRMKNKDLKRYTIVSLLFAFFYYVPAIIAIILKEDINIESILIIQCCGLMTFIFFISARPIWIMRENLFKKQKIDIYKSFFKYGLPIAIGTIAVGMFIRVDRYVIEYVLGSKELGVYSAAYNLSNLAVSSFFSILTISTYPEILRLLNDEKISDAKAIYTKNGTIILTIIPLSICIFCLFNESICNIFFGAKGPEIAYIFPFVIIATYLFNLKVHYFDQVFQFTKTTKISMLLSLVLGVSHIFLSYQFSKYFALPGVAISSSILSFIGIFFTYLFSINRFKIRINNNLIIGNSIISIGLIIYLFNHYKN